MLFVLCMLWYWRVIQLCFDAEWSTAVFYAMIQHQLEPELSLSSLNGSPTTSTTFLNNISSNRMILVAGRPGSGKSTLLNRLCSSTFNTSLIDLSKETSVKVTAHLKTCLHKGSSDEVTCIDSFDKFLQSTSKLSDAEDILSIANKIPAARRGSVVIAARKSATNFLFHYLDVVHQYYCVEGFTDEGIRQYMNTCSLYKDKDVSKMKEENQLLYEMCKTPSICREFCILSGSLKANASLTETVETLILNFVQQKQDKIARSKVKNFDTLPPDEKSSFKMICKLAFEVLVRGQKFEDEESSSHFLSSFCLRESISSVSSIKTLDLIDIGEHFHFLTDLTKTNFWFISVHVQHFLCGYYLSDLPPLDQVFFLCEHAKELIDSGYHGWLHYFFGLSTRSGRQFNPTGMMVNSINELLLSCLDLEKSLHTTVFLTSLVETREKSYWRKLGSRKEKIFNITLSLSEFKQARKALMTMVEHSGIKEWLLEADESNLKIVAELVGEHLKTSVRLSQNKSLVDDIRLRPRADTSAALDDRRFKSKPDGSSNIKVTFSYFMCRALREIMQRVLQLFSKVKLKGDSSNTSYLSFLSCQCLEEAIEKNVSFLPYIPIHYLPVPGKGKQSLDDSDPTGKHLREKHDGEAVELVILLQPTLRIMTFILPGTNKQYDITLSSDVLPEYLVLEKSYYNIHDLQDISCSQSHEQSPEKSERVYPGLPIPLNHPELMGGHVVIPEIAMAKARLSASKKNSEEDDDWEGNVMKARKGDEEAREEHETKLPGHEYGRFQADVEGSSEQRRRFRKVERNSDGNASKTWNQEEAAGGSGSLVMPFVHSKGLQKSATSSSESGHTSRRYRQPPTTKPLTAMRAGTVSYSIIPERLSADQIHALPDERSPVQVGGNGIILRGELKGLPVAIKRTAYRTRELNVMVKLNHPNVLRLLAFMWGEENPNHKRHYFAYHFYDLFHGEKNVFFSICIFCIVLYCIVFFLFLIS